MEKQEINGFVDLQNNGGWGIDFSSPELSVDQVKFLVQKLWSKGVAMLCPTLITGDPDVVTNNLRTIVQARKENPLMEFSIPAIHLEGFLISSEPGYRGAHNPTFIWEAAYIGRRIFDEWQDVAGGLIKIFTLAPEAAGSIDFIADLVCKGIIVALGHTNANEYQIDLAIKAGATGATHLGNGCPKMMDRSNNIIQRLLARRELWASFIPDGFHVPWPAFKNFTIAKGRYNSFVVTDSVHMTGMPAGKGKLNELDIEMLENGKICLSGTENLAGSSLTMNKAYNNLMSLGFGGTECQSMTSLIPARIIGVSKKLAKCQVIIGDSGEVVLTAIRGEKVFQKK